MENKKGDPSFLGENSYHPFGFGIMATMLAVFQYLSDPTRINNVKKGADKMIGKLYSNIGKIILPSKSLKL